MTFKEAKDQILKNKGLDPDYPFSDGVLLDIYKEAAELYAESRAKRFSVWYSGMDGNKVEKAYERFLKESK